MIRPRAPPGRVTVPETFHVPGGILANFWSAPAPCRYSGWRAGTLGHAAWLWLCAALRISLCPL
jgi:hypothetical protein